jgi:hypothetical protein
MLVWLLFRLACVLRVGRMGMGRSRGQDAGTINARARLYAQVGDIGVSNGAELGGCPFATLKNASCLASVAAILARPETKFESRMATDSASVRMAPTPTELSDLPSERNSLVFREGKMY